MATPIKSIENSQMHVLFWFESRICCTLFSQLWRPPKIQTPVRPLNWSNLGFNASIQCQRHFTSKNADIANCYVIPTLIAPRFEMDTTHDDLG